MYGHHVTGLIQSLSRIFVRGEIKTIIMSLIIQSRVIKIQFEQCRVTATLLRQRGGGGGGVVRGRVWSVGMVGEGLFMELTRNPINKELHPTAVSENCFSSEILQHFNGS